jgi:transposase
MHTHQKSSDPVATIGLDIGKNTFHLVGLDKRGAIAIRIKVSRNQLVRRLVNLPCCLLGLEAGSGCITRALDRPLGHDVRLIPPQYVKHGGASKMAEMRWCKPHPDWLPHR